MQHKIPVLLTLVGMIGGVVIAILFGADESIFKDRIKTGLSRNVAIQSVEDAPTKAELIKSEADKSWRYYQRYHFHANGISGLALALLVFLAFINVSTSQKLVASYLISVGGFLYPFVWLFAALYGPEMGRSQAKEAFALFGYSGGLFLVGIIFTLYLAMVKSWKEPF